jgi:hypothetical protein
MRPVSWGRSVRPAATSSGRPVIGSQRTGLNGLPGACGYLVGAPGDGIVAAAGAGPGAAFAREARSGALSQAVR